MKSFPVFPLLAALLIWSAGAFAHGMLASLEPVSRIQPGVTTAAQVRELLGRPARTPRYHGLEVLEYDAFDYNNPIAIAISIGPDGKVRDVQRIHRSFP